MPKLDTCYSCRSCGDPCYLIKTGPHMFPFQCQSNATIKVEWRRLREIKKHNKPKPKCAKAMMDDVIVLCQQGFAEARKQKLVWFEHIFERIEAAVLAQQQAK